MGRLVPWLRGCLEPFERVARLPAIDRNETAGDVDVPDQLGGDVARAAPEQPRPVPLGPEHPGEVLLRSGLRLEHPAHAEPGRIYPLLPPTAPRRLQQRHAP